MGKNRVKMERVFSDNEKVMSYAEAVAFYANKIKLLKLNKQRASVLRSLPPCLFMPVIENYAKHMKKHHS